MGMVVVSLRLCVAYDILVLVSYFSTLTLVTYCGVCFTEWSNNIQVVFVLLPHDAIC